jgi:hypothetical protein
MTNKQHTRSRPFWGWKKVLVLFGLVAVLYTLLSWHDRLVPLPKDEEMIAYLQAHRAEFEELVRRHRTFISREYDPNIEWPGQEPGTPELMKQAGVNSIDYLLLGNWLPDPYSPATTQRARAIKEACSADWKQWHAMDGRKNHLPPPQCRLLGYQYGVLEVKPEPYNGFYAHSWRYVSVWKDYLHFPEPPRIEDGCLLGPMLADGRYMYKKRAFSSLNYYPWRWKEYECVYRPIDEHWFIRLCNGH